MQSGRADLALAYLAEFRPGRLIECVESLQPPHPRSKKWVLIVSSLFGCPVRCPMCDAGGDYRGRLSAEEILAQIDFLVRGRFPDGRVPVEKFKIQFARVGEPAFNPAVLDALDALPGRYRADGLHAAVSTIAPQGCELFFERLREIKERHYSAGRFQLQFSLHTTDPRMRDRLIPWKKWSLAQIRDYGRVFRRPGDRKITLNFALANDAVVDPETLRRHFDPAEFLIKITPLNPTYAAARNRLDSRVDGRNPPDQDPLFASLRAAGYDVLLSIGEIAENQIGSNCGQYLQTHLRARNGLCDGYRDVPAPAEPRRGRTRPARSFAADRLGR